MKLGGDRGEELGEMDCLFKTHMHINTIKRKKRRKEKKRDREVEGN